MNTDDQGRNLAEARRRDWDLGITASRVPSSKLTPVHGGRPDPRCACAGTGYVVDGNEVIPCPEHVLAAPVSVSAVPDPRGLPDVDWECVAGRALAALQTTANELKRLRSEMPADAMCEYDRRHHAGA